MHSLKKTSWYKSVLIFQNKSHPCLSQSTSAVAEKTDTIVIPNRIERGPTDILKALSHTIQQDPLAPHYKYHDDPFTIPVSNQEKRSFALAQESGKKAAQWIRATHADLFQHRVAEPFIEMYAPRLVYSENEVVSPEFLSQLIANGSVTDAIQTYQRLEKDSVEVGDELKQSLLELVCYYNCEDSVPGDLLEERWFTQGKHLVPKYNTWKDNEFSEILFKSFPEPGAAQYASIIQGMLKYNQVERALSFFEEAKSKGLALPVDVFNLVLGKVNFVKEGFEHRMQMIVEILSEMNLARVSPTVDTLNEVLNQLSLMASFRDSKKMALKTLSEMRKFGVKPCLASYNHLLFLFCRDRGPTSGILYSILDELESRVHTGEPIQVQDLRDNQFFSGAMEIARRHLADVSCAYRIDKLLHSGHNYNFIGESTRESAYYRNFFFLVLSREPFETFVELYDRLVPNVYSPEKSVMMEFIKAADLNGKIEFYPRLWAEVNMLELWQQEDLLSYLLESLNRNLFAAPAELVPQLADVVWSVYSKVEEQNSLFLNGRSRQQAVEWTAVTLGHIMNVMLADSRLNEVDTIFGRILREDLAGIPEFTTMETYFNRLVEEKNLARSMGILQYLSELGFSNLKPMGDKLEANFTLTSAEQTKVLTLVGDSNRNNTASSEEEATST
uniref:Small ribosomal subunit protein mS39 n=1 Tax=Cacopsylla melanoneura TaxID=428564 RepID=A0A8D9BDW6_9HEMI